MQDFRKIEVWQQAHQVTLRIYGITRSFPREELYGLVSQMRPSSGSIPTNIAEGCVRRTDMDFARYLYHSLGSASELEYQVLLSHDLGYMTAVDHIELTSDIQRIKRMLTAFIKRLDGSNMVDDAVVQSRQPTAESRQPHA